MRTNRRVKRMPWKNLPPETGGLLLQMLGLLIAGLTGTASRILDEVRTGKRKKIWSQELVIDATSFMMMVLVAAGVSEFLSLGPYATAAVGGVLCRGGTPLLDIAIKLIISTYKHKGPKQ